MRARCRAALVCLCTVLAPLSLTFLPGTSSAQTSPYTARYESDAGGSICSTAWPSHYSSNSGTWGRAADARASGGSYCSYGPSAGDGTHYLEFTFTGVAAVPVMLQSTGQGQFAYSVDGGSETTCDDNGTLVWQYTGCGAVTGLTYGAHTYRLRALGTTTNGSTSVVVDAFDVNETAPTTTTTAAPTTTTTVAPTTTTTVAPTTTVPPTTTTTVTQVYDAVAGVRSSWAQIVECFFLGLIAGLLVVR